MIPFATGLSKTSAKYRNELESFSCAPGTNYVCAKVSYWLDETKPIQVAATQLSLKDGGLHWLRSCEMADETPLKVHSMWWAETLLLSIMWEDIQAILVNKQKPDVLKETITHALYEDAMQRNNVEI